MNKPELYAEIIHSIVNDTDMNVDIKFEVLKELFSQHDAAILMERCRHDYIGTDAECGRI